MYRSKYNGLTRYHNDLLRRQVEALQKDHPYAKIAFADYYSPVLSFLRRPANFGEIDS